MREKFDSELVECGRTETRKESHLPLNELREVSTLASGVVISCPCIVLSRITAEKTKFTLLKTLLTREFLVTVSSQFTLLLLNKSVKNVQFSPCCIGAD